MSDYDYRKLKGRIVEKMEYQCRFAEALGISKNCLTARLRNRYPFTVPEMEIALKVLDLEPKDIPEYFLHRRCSNAENR